MVAEYSRSRLVPISLLDGASCLLPERRFSVGPASDASIGGLPRPAPASRANCLTPAEHRVCELILQGLSNKEISSVLGRAEPTIKNQVAAVLRKCGVPSRARLLALLR